MLNKVWLNSVKKNCKTWRWYTDWSFPICTLYKLQFISSFIHNLFFFFKISSRIHNYFWPISLSVPITRTCISRHALETSNYNKQNFKLTNVQERLSKYKNNGFSETSMPKRERQRGWGNEKCLNSKQITSQRIFQIHK